MHWLVERFKTAPDRQAFIHRGKVITYSEVITKIEFFSLQLQHNNIRPGDVVILIGDYSPEIFCLMLSLVLNNNIILPLTIESVIDESIALGISGSDWRIELSEGKDEFKIRKQEVSSDNLLIKEFRAKNYPGLVLFSSGSTGRPKGMLYNFNRILEKFRKQRKPVIAIPFLMIDHFGGINTIFSIVSSLGTVVTTHDRAVASICLAMEKYKVELLPTTPSFLTLLMASKIYNQFDKNFIKDLSILDCLFHCNLEKKFFLNT